LSIYIVYCLLSIKVDAMIYNKIKLYKCCIDLIYDYNLNLKVGTTAKPKLTQNQKKKKKKKHS